VDEVKDMELKGFEEMGEGEERSVQGGYYYYGRCYPVVRPGWGGGYYGRYWW
jgi:hypothetical protein